MELVKQITDLLLSDEIDEAFELLKHEFKSFENNDCIIFINDYFDYLFMRNKERCRFAKLIDKIKLEVSDGRVLYNIEWILFNNGVISPEEYMTAIDTIKPTISDEEFLCSIEFHVFDCGLRTPEQLLFILNDKISNNCICAYKYRAELSQRMGMLDEAAKDIKKALEINPNEEFFNIK